MSSIRSGIKDHNHSQGNLFQGALKEKPGVDMIDDKTQDNTVINRVSYFFTIFRYLPVKLYIHLCDLRSMASYRVNENEAALLFSRLLMAARLSIVCICTRMATQRPNVAQIIETSLELTAVGKLKT